MQVDLVPTLAMLLDLPIPYSNLGAIIRELFPNEATRLQAAKANVWQVRKYVLDCSVCSETSSGPTRPTIYNTFYNSSLLKQINIFLGGTLHRKLPH